MKELLEKFYNDVHTREAVKDFIIAELKASAIENVFAKKATAGIYEANRAIENAFEKLEDEFGKKEKKKEPATSR